MRQLPAATVSHRRRFGLLGQALEVETNDPRVLDLAGTAFGRFPVPDGVEPLALTVIVERSRGVPAEPAGIDPGDRRNGHHGASEGDLRAADSHRFDDVVYRTHGATVLLAGRDRDVATMDPTTGRATAYVGESAFRDPRGLRFAFLEALAYWMLAYPRGYLAMHATGIGRGSVGVIVEGPAGAGKSTVAVAAARRGLSVFAEDAVFARLAGDGLELWGTPWVQRLLPDAAKLFPELATLPIVRQPNGEDKLEVDLVRWFPGTAVPSARPGAFVSLVRDPGAPTELLPAAAPDDSPEFLWPYDLDWPPAQHAVAEAIEALPAYRLCVGGGPDEAVDALEELLDRLVVAAGRASVG
ncbi:MAG TPA: hypothetical protein VNL94_08970 [Candidatus Binatia bacterium]|nr:hypothetical protein [Candidatus Binatia bacterium]